MKRNLKIANLSKGTPLRMYRTRNIIRAYKTGWSRKTGHRRILRRVGAKVTPKSVGAIVKSPTLHIKMTLIRVGAFFWGHANTLVRRCQIGHLLTPGRKVAAIKHNRRRLQERELQHNVPTGWDLYDE